MDAPQGYAVLLDDLQQTVNDALEQHPRLGRRFLSRLPRSLEVRGRVAKLQERLGGVDLREYLVGDYMVLYGVDGEVGSARRPILVYLLAIRHHRQLSFDFDGLWRAGQPDLK